MSIKVIIDSSAYLPAGLADQFGIRCIPLHVSVNGQSQLDGVNFTSAHLVSALRANSVVTTSRPALAEFVGLYERELAAGADHIISVHLSSELSGTFHAAQLAAQEVDISRIHVIDSRSTAMGMGYLALAAAKADTVANALATIQQIASEVQMYFCVPSLDYLHQGGRIGTIATFAGNVLAIKPILSMRAGKILPIEKVRTMNRALDRIVDLTVASIKEKPVALTVHHLAEPDRAAELAQRLACVLPQARCFISEVGPVIGAHVGPGLLGIVIGGSTVFPIIERI